MLIVLSVTSRLLNVESQLNLGATFHIYLTLAEVNNGPLIIKADSKPPHGSGIILLVEDNPQVLESTAEQLQQLGYQIELFAVPGEALASSQDRSDKTDVIITD